MLADGDIDALGACNEGNEITWWENQDGAGTAWMEHTLDTEFYYALWAYAQDVDGDGDHDILGAAAQVDEVAWWEVSTFVSEGYLESTVLDIQDAPDWRYIDWTSTESTGTAVGLQVRASDDPGNMGAWSDTLYSPDSLSGMLADGESLFQYRAILSTSDPDSTPLLRQVTVSWESLFGVQGETAHPADGSRLLGALPNPTFGTAVLSFALPADSRAELTVYDLSGRVVSRTEDSYPAGTHRVQLQHLASGVYLVRMRAGEFTATRRFVVIE
jgi:hypothetical protein